MPLTLTAQDVLGQKADLEEFLAQMRQHEADLEAGLQVGSTFIRKEAILPNRKYFKRVGSTLPATHFSSLGGKGKRKKKGTTQAKVTPNNEGWGGRGENVFPAAMQVARSPVTFVL